MNNNTTIKMLLIPEVEWKSVLTSLKRLESLFTEKSQVECSTEWIDGNTARKMLGVSEKTWQLYRDRRTIPFAQFGRKIMVRKEDVEAFLKDHFITK